MNNKTRVWPGRVLTSILTVLLAGSAITKIAGVPKIVDGLISAGIPRDAILPIAILELSCLALYVFPRTTALGTLLLTGYLGGATVTHVIGGENLAPPLVVGLLAWIGAYFRVPEFQELLPVRRTDSFGAYDEAFRHQPSPTRG